MNPPFSYPLLSHARCTRVILLQPANDRAAPIICSLAEIDLELPANKRKSYEALSYVWGSPVADNEILCDGGSLLVTTSCLVALQYLRLKEHTRTLWIDAICINQKSIKERNNQVMLMGDVYRYALRVVIWLGEATGASEQALRQLQKSERFRRFFKSIIWLGESMGALEQTLSALRRAERFRRFLTPFRDPSLHEPQRSLFPLTDGECQALKILLGNEWWQRTWTLQELLFANQPSLMCGNFILDFETFAQSQGVHADDPRIGGEEARREFLRCSELRSLYRNLHDKPKQGNVSQSSLSGAKYHSSRVFTNELFLGAQSRKATDEKDKIYGLHQILYSCGIALPEPNYALSTAQIYTEATVALIQGTMSLRIFEMQEKGHKRLDLPSWVPDFSQVQYLKSSLTMDCLISQEVHIPIYRDGRLDIRGRIISNITQLTGRLQKDPQLRGVNDGLFDRLFKVLRSGLEPGNENIVNQLHFTFWDTSIDAVNFADLPNLEGDAQRNTFKSFEYLDDAHNEEHIEMAVEKPEEPLGAINETGEVGKLICAREWSMPLRQMASLNFGREAFVASTGDVGLTRADIRTGDLLVLFNGASVPCILRPAGENHRFIGLARGMYRFRRRPRLRVRDDGEDMTNFSLV